MKYNYVRRYRHRNNSDFVSALISKETAANEIYIISLHRKSDFVSATVSNESEASKGRISVPVRWYRHHNRDQFVSVVISTETDRSQT